MDEKRVEFWRRHLGGQSREALAFQARLPPSEVEPQLGEAIARLLADSGGHGFTRSGDL